jgi:hypothetical protein
VGGWGLVLQEDEKPDLVSRQLSNLLYPPFP